MPLLLIYTKKKNIDLNCICNGFYHKRIVLAIFPEKHTSLTVTGGVLKNTNHTQWRISCQLMCGQKSSTIYCAIVAVFISFLEMDHRGTQNFVLLVFTKHTHTHENRCATLILILLDNNKLNFVLMIFLTKYTKKKN